MIPDREDLHALVKAFVSVHHENVKDDIGPNKPDAPFFERLARADELSFKDYTEMADRFYKYIGTQLPVIAHIAGYTPETDFAAALAELQFKGIKYNYTLGTAKEELKGTYTDSYSPDNDKAYKTHLLHKYPDLLEQDVDDLVQAHVNEANQRLNDYHVTCEEYEETWYGKNDPHRRWPRTTKRIAITWNKRNRALWNTLKDDPVLKWPAFKWDGIRMSCKHDRNVLTRVIEILDTYGYITDDLVTMRDCMTAPVPRSNESFSVTIVKDSVLLGIPYNEARTREIVRGINGRKWLQAQKKWRVSIHESANLIRLLGDTHELSVLMLADERVSSMVEAKAERIAISGASALDDDDVVADMKERLSEEFPEGYELYPFQYTGVRFAELAEGRCFIGDDMGVGKTIQAIAYAALHTELWPVLVVCPANVKYNWVKELTTWLPNCGTDVVVNGKDTLEDADFTVINYDLVHKKKDELLDFGYNLVIFDESHYLKNRGTKSKPVLRTQACIEIGQTTESVLCLSGTAMTNRPIELFTTLELVRPAEYEGQFMPFAKRYCGAEHNGFGWDFSGATHTDELHEKLRDVMIRRLKKEVMDELPDKVRSFVPVIPTPAELRRYQDSNRSWVRQYNSGGKAEPGFVLNMLTDLRHQCGRLKVSAALKWIEEYKHQNDKPLIVFTHHRDVMQALCEAMEEDYKYATISGSVPAKMRAEFVEQFQAGELDVLVCSTVAAKEGLTLTAADTVLFIEREWSPAWEEQAEDRVNRIGQDSDTVWATYLSVAGTIDEKFDRIVEAKRQDIKAVLDGGDIIEREGIAKALLEAMVEAGELPEEMLTGFSKYTEEE
tara:strand:- start:4274 stop:6787 length:2514 start_codon:yes stop_codon:yes gene_type:complete